MWGPFTGESTEIKFAPGDNLLCIADVNDAVEDSLENSFKSNHSLCKPRHTLLTCHQYLILGKLGHYRTLQVKVCLSFMHTVHIQWDEWVGHIAHSPPE